LRLKSGVADNSKGVTLDEAIRCVHALRLAAAIELERSIDLPPQKGVAPTYPESLECKMH